MAPQITIIGGGSNQWVPKLLIDFVNTPSLHEAEIVLEDVKDDNLPRMQRFVEHCAEVRGIGMTCRTTTDQRESLHGADFVVVSISTGGFESMRSDLEIPARFGLFQTVGDTVGPGGIMRGLRNIPVMV
ncbi:MAG: galacturan 1,4-alpha-galacturonidase, partial [Acidimicrobiaceae bacterium]